MQTVSDWSLQSYIQYIGVSIVIVDSTIHSLVWYPMLSAQMGENFSSFSNFHLQKLDSTSKFFIGANWKPYEHVYDLVEPHILRKGACFSKFQTTRVMGTMLPGLSRLPHTTSMQIGKCGNIFQAPSCISILHARLAANKTPV